MMASIEDLYHSYSVLAEAKEKAGENVAAYRAIISGTKSGPSQKRLASQFITRFHKHFPGLADESLEAMFDLCEDNDFNVIKQAVRDLPQMCKDSLEYCQRATCVLLQLLPAVLPSEQNIISDSLLTIFKAHTKEILKHMFVLMASGDQDFGHQAISFLHTKLKLILSDDPSNEIEEIIIVCSKKVIDDVNDEDCLLLIKMLKMLPSMATLTGRLLLLDVISVRLHMSKSPDDFEEIQRALMFLKETDGLFSKTVPSTDFVKYICLSVFPLIMEQDDDLMSGILQVLAEMVVCYDDSTGCESCLDNVYSCINHVIPNPVLSDEQDVLSSPEIEIFTTEKLMHIECILIAFHRLCRSCPQFFTVSENADRLKSLRARLQLVSRSVQMLTKKLPVKLENGANLKHNSEQSKSTEIQMNNIMSVVKDFFHNPPALKSDIILSLKTVGCSDEGKSNISGEKRKFHPLTFATAENSVKKAKISTSTAANQSSKSTVNFGQRKNFRKIPAQQNPFRGFSAGVHRQNHLIRGRGGIQRSQSLNLRKHPHHSQVQGRVQGRHHPTMQTNLAQGHVPQNDVVVRPNMGNNSAPPLMNLQPAVSDQYAGNKNNYHRLNQSVGNVAPPRNIAQRLPAARGRGFKNRGSGNRGFGNRGFGNRGFGSGQRKVVLRDGFGK